VLLRDRNDNPAVIPTFCFPHFLRFANRLRLRSMLSVRRSEPLRTQRGSSGPRCERLP
jgi:hypothetical protein